MERNRKWQRVRGSMVEGMLPKLNEEQRDKLVEKGAYRLVDEVFAKAHEKESVVQDNPAGSPPDIVWKRLDAEGRTGKLIALREEVLTWLQKNGAGLSPQDLSKLSAALGKSYDQLETTFNMVKGTE